uniref:Uncharacterized protein n=1 Tax=Anguilla anguilla TaxID=7936 RepID=A0A0E9UAN3_ANGAN
MIAIRAAVLAQFKMSCPWLQNCIIYVQNA